MINITSLTLSERDGIYAYRKMKLSVNQIAVKLVELSQLFTMNYKELSLITLT